MKYLKSTTAKAYKFDKFVIPPYNKDMLSLSTTAYNDLLKNKVAKSLIDAGAIFVTDTAPTNPTKQAQELTNQNARLILENTQLKEQLAKAGTTDALQAELDTAKAALEKQRTEDLAEIKALQEEKDAKIAELEAQLAEAQKKAAKK